MNHLNYRTLILGFTILLSAGCNRQPSFAPAEGARPSSSAPAAVAVEPRRPGSVETDAPPVRHSNRRPSTSDSYTAERTDSYIASAPVKGRSKLRSAEIIGGTAGVGAAIGALAGGGKGAAIGALAGGGAGLVYDRTTAHKAARE